VVPAVGQGVMEDALEPSLGGVIWSYTRKGVVAAPKSAKKEVCGQSFIVFLSGLRPTNSLCFPMIPMTVSFFLPKQSERHYNAIVYGFQLLLFMFLGF
jgi:hypothetical protein